MCQLCDEANLYMAQLEAAERKAVNSPQCEKLDQGTKLPSKFSVHPRPLSGEIDPQKIAPKARVT